MNIYDILSHFREDFVIMEGEGRRCSRDSSILSNDTPKISPLTLAVAEDTQIMI